MGRIGRSLLAACAALLVAAPASHARDAVVRSFDGTPIVTHFFPARDVKGTAPTIMVGHGWGGSGSTSPPADYAKEYNVLTWDARGFGGSGGTVMIDHPEFEARDVQALIDFVAKQPEAQLDGKGDPRVGMDGPSYGGGIQFISAARDKRIDAITPTIAWNSLVTSLNKSDSIKIGWGLALSGLGVPTSLLPGILSPAGIQTGHQSPQFFSLITQGAATGRFTGPDNQWLNEHGPHHLLSKLSAPTLIVEGTVDTLFTLDEAHRNYTQLRNQGVPVKMMWFCGGHGACFTGSDTGDNPVSGIAGDGGLVAKRKLAWFKRYLQGIDSTSTGADFEWIDEAGKWSESFAYPQRQVGSTGGSGSGTMLLTPGVNPSGVAIFATPAASAPPTVTIPIQAPPAGSEIIGAPKLDLTYSATGVAPPLTGDGKTHIFAQLIDKQRNLVVNNLATPIPIEMNAGTKSISIDLERIASRSTAAGYELQLIPQTTMYDAQRAAGTVNISTARVELPLTRGVSACSYTIKGTRKRNRLKGSNGPDKLLGRGGPDQLKGRQGNDCLKGGPGRDRLRGGAGDDVLKARKGGRDRLDCGDGQDKALANIGRDKVKNCEVVNGRKAKAKKGKKGKRKK